jgi:replicative DNA helicase
MEPSNSGAKIHPLREREGDQPSYRVPPYNQEAEQALLGAILVNNQAYHKIADFLRPEHFADPAHGNIFEIASRLIEQGQIASPITLKPYFEQGEGLAEHGGAAYLARLAGAAVTIINTRHYGRTIHDFYLRRQLIDIGEEVVNQAYSPEIEVTATLQIEGAERKLYDLATSGELGGGFHEFRQSLGKAIDMAEAAFKRDGRLTGVATGFGDVDRLLGGLHASDLVVLAGRPSMGKTALATNIAFHAASAYREETDEEGARKVVDGAVVGFFSLEMSEEQLATRLLSEASGIPSEKIRRGQLTHDEFQRVVQMTRALETLKFYIDDTPALSMPALRARARRLKRLHGLGLIVVDYLQLLQPGGARNQENRVQEISTITRGLKTLAKELSVPVIALSQLSRAVEQRDNKRPQLSDLRESGSIEQDADVVMFIYREEYYLARQEPPQNSDKHLDWEDKLKAVEHLAEVTVAKQRHGPIGKVQLRFEGELTTFKDYVADDHLPDAGPPGSFR